MTNEELEELIATMSKATPRPWRVGRSVGRTVYSSPVTDGGVFLTNQFLSMNQGPITLFSREEDAAAAVAAVNATTNLALSLKALRFANDVLQRRVRELEAKLKGSQ